MHLTVQRKPDAIYARFSPSDSWKMSTFFPLVDAMVRQIRNHWDTSPAPIIFDISALEYIDSTFISLVIQVARSAFNRRNSIITTSRQCTDLIMLLGLDRFVEIHESYEDWQAAAACSDEPS